MPSLPCECSQTERSRQTWARQTDILPLWAPNRAKNQYWNMFKIVKVLEFSGNIRFKFSRRIKIKGLCFWFLSTNLIDICLDLRGCFVCSFCIFKEKWCLSFVFTLGSYICTFDIYQYNFGMFHIGFFISSFVIPVSAIFIMYLVMILKLWSKVSTRISKWVSQIHREQTVTHENMMNNTFHTLQRRTKS